MSRCGRYFPKDSNIVSGIESEEVSPLPLAGWWDARFEVRIIYPPCDPNSVIEFLNSILALESRAATDAAEFVITGALKYARERIQAACRRPVPHAEHVIGNAGARAEMLMEVRSPGSPDLVVRNWVAGRIGNSIVI